MDIIKILQEELGIRRGQVETTIKLIDEGNTIPFIARYRKEMTGSLDDETLRNFHERLLYLRNLEERKEAIKKNIEEQGKLTKELAKQIEEAKTLVAVEDLYRPYKQKKRTRAMIAKEKGLEPLANLILLQMTKEPLEKKAEAFINEEKDVKTVEDALKGANDIIAERIADDAEYRTWIRKATWDHGKITSSAKKPEESSVFEMYYDFEEPIEKIAGYRILAINRGEKEGILQVKIEPDMQKIASYLARKIITRKNPNTTKALFAAIEDSYKRLIAPSIERDIRNELTENASTEAIKVFGKNLAQLLMQPPIAGQVVLGWDPAFRTGCKLAVVDATGKVLDTVVIYPTAPQNKVEEAKKVVKALIKKYGITLISIGNGTASRESEQIVVDMLKEIKEPVQYVITNEAGASVYSASKLATEEFPNFDVGQRSATSIARRVQDPLAELVKIEPKAIGVGQYQHDMNQKRLGEALGGVVENCVNSVGVDLNTASPSLLSYVAGINKTVSKNIITYREENGKFNTRKELLKVPKLGAKAFEQCAGFLRITDGDNVLDNTSVHPESYKAAAQLLKHMGYTEQDVQDGTVADLKQRLSKENTHKFAEELGIGEITLKDIADSIIKKGRDPREELPQPVLRSDILSMEDLKPDMVLTGTVRNVIDFGAFVDIGVHQDGLVHISQICDRYIKHPTDVLSVGDVVKVRVLEVDVPKKRISLTMKEV